MNIFYLHKRTRKCAMYHVDRHVVKMILETCQLLCTAIWVSIREGKEKPNREEPPFKSTHEKHPSAIWTRESKENWKWLRRLGKELCKEYTYRYNKIHKCESIIQSLKCPNLPDKEFTQPLQAMPDEYKHKNSIIAYRKYYLHGKKHLHLWTNRHAWKNRNVPKFILKFNPEYENF